jgi:sulfatase maturation enzyme AslB (radical SAM superfamily)
MVCEKDEEGEGAYYSCHEIEGAVTLINAAITMCGHVHSRDKGMPPICDYAGGEVPCDRVRAARDELRRRNQTGEDTLCKGCRFLRKRRWTASPYLVRHVTIGHYTPCNFRCCYCYRNAYSSEESARLNRPSYRAGESVTSLFSQGAMAPDSTAWLTGGEPTLFVDFDELMEALMAHGVRTTVGTNCARISDKISRGLRSDLVEVLCSVDSGTREKFREIKGKDEYDRIWATLAHYAACNGSNVIAKYIVMDENASEIEARAFVDQCRSIHVRKISISRDIRRYRGVLSDSDSDMPERLFQMIALMACESIKSGIQVVFDANWAVFNDAELMRINRLMQERGCG